MSKMALVLAFFCFVWCLSPGGAMAQIAGDANGDGGVDVGDVIYEINYLFVGGPAPVFYECGDPNVDCKIDVADVVYLINYLFIEGPDPQILDCLWSEPVNLGEPINSPRGEESFRMTPDGRMAIWSLSRYGTHGNNDIWYSFWDSLSGSWSEPQNCGLNVNTVIEDLGPCLSPDGKKLYYVQFERPEDMVDGTSGSPAGIVSTMSGVCQRIWDQPSTLPMRNGVPLYHRMVLNFSLAMGGLYLFPSGMVRAGTRQ